jgi:hypothetical protein
MWNFLKFYCQIQEEKFLKSVREHFCDLNLRKTWRRFRVIREREGRSIRIKDDENCDLEYLFSFIGLVSL